MNRKLFDPRLYRNGLAQLRLAGSLFCVLAVLATGLPCLFVVLQARQLEAVGEAMSYPAFQIVTILLVGVMFLAPIALCLTVFGFLNHRNSSDFYHSIPQTRGCLFASFGAAALTWGYAAILLGVGTAAAVFGLSGAAGHINFAPLPYVLGTDLAGITLLTAQMLLAMSVTGTVVTNFTVFGLLVFLPRFLLTVFAHIVIARLRFITTDAFGFFGNSLYNIPASFFLTVFDGTPDKLFTTAGPIWYTLALAAVCFAAAGLLFCRRRSESAGRSAPNRPLQHIYRCLIALPPSLIIPYTIVSWNPANGDFMAHNLNMVITVTAVTLLVYFLFELISTKTPRNLLRAAPVFLAVAAFDVAFGLASVGTQSWFLRDIPPAADIRSVTFEYTNSNSGRAQTYNQIMVKRAALSDSRLTGTVAQALAQTARKVKGQDFGTSGFEYQVLLRLKNGRMMERKLYATDAEIQTIEGIKASDPQFHSAQTDLPPEQNIRQITLGGFDADDARKIWNSFRSEYGTLTDAQKQQLSGTTSTHGKTAAETAAAQIAESEDSIATLTVQGPLGLENYQSSYGITSLTPKTMALFIQTANRQNGPLLWSRIKRLAEGDQVAYAYSLVGRNLDPKLTDSQDSGVLLASNSTPVNTTGAVSAADRQIMALLLRHRDDSAPSDISQPMAEIEFSHFGGQISYSSQPVFFQLSADEIKQILALKQGAKTETG